MLSHLFDAQRARLALIWLCVMVPVTWSEPSLPPRRASEAQAPTLRRAATVCGPDAQASRGVMGPRDWRPGSSAAAPARSEAAPAPPPPHGGPLGALLSASGL